MGSNPRELERLARGIAGTGPLPILGSEAKGDESFAFTLEARPAARRKVAMLACGPGLLPALKPSMFSGHCGSGTAPCRQVGRRPAIRFEQPLTLKAASTNPRQRIVLTCPI